MRERPSRLQVFLLGGVIPVGEVGDEVQQGPAQGQRLVIVQIGPADGIPEPGHDGCGIGAEPGRAVLLGRIGPEGSTDHRPAGR